MPTPPIVVPSSDPTDPTDPSDPRRPGVVPDAAGTDSAGWHRHVERKRRAYQNLIGLRRGTVPGVMARRVGSQAKLPQDFTSQLTFHSFRLEGIAVESADVEQALRPLRRKGGFRSRLHQRLRNHVALIRSIDRGVRLGRRMTVPLVLRWYTSISSGLSTTMPAGQKLDRLERVVRQINSPPRRLEPALAETADLYAEAFADELVPGFNGILIRLLLQAHLGSSKLPPVIFPLTLSPDVQSSGPLFSPWLIGMVEESLDRLTPRRR